MGWGWDGDLNVLAGSGVGTSLGGGETDQISSKCPARHSRDDRRAGSAHLGLQWSRLMVLFAWLEGIVLTRAPG